MLWTRQEFNNSLSWSKGLPNEFEEQRDSTNLQDERMMVHWFDNGFHTSCHLLVFCTIIRQGHLTYHYSRLTIHDFQTCIQQFFSLSFISVPAERPQRSRAFTMTPASRGGTSRSTKIKVFCSLGCHRGRYSRIVCLCQRLPRLHFS